MRRRSTRLVVLLAAVAALLVVAGPGDAAKKRRLDAPHFVSGGNLPPTGIGIEYNYPLVIAGGSPGYTCEHGPGGGPVPSGFTISPSCEVRGNAYPYYGPFDFNVTAQDSIGQRTTGNFHIDVEFIRWSAGTIADGSVGTAYTGCDGCRVRAYGGTDPFTYTLVSGSLPPGLTLQPDGTITGTPTRAGNFSFTVKATDSVNVYSTGDFTARIGLQPIALTPATLPNGTAGAAYNASLSASGGAGPYAFSLASGALPPGLTLQSGGAITGAPTKVGSYSFAIRVSGSGGNFSTKSYTIIVNFAVLTVAPGTLPDATSESAYSQALTVTGGTAPYTFALASGDTLPPGLTLSAAGVITGTPSAKAGAYGFTVEVTDSFGSPAALKYTLNLKAPTISLTPGTLKPATSGKQFAATIVAAGGKGPYAYSIASGDLPPGLKFGSDGVLSGTPSAPAGNFSFTVNAVDANSAVGTVQFQLVLLAPRITLKPRALAGGVVGIKYHASMTATGGEGPYTYSIAKGRLAPGVHLSAKGLFRGTPKTDGTYRFTVVAKDRNGATAKITVKLDVVAPGAAVTAAAKVKTP